MQCDSCSKKNIMLCIVLETNYNSRDTAYVAIIKNCGSFKICFGVVYMNISLSQRKAASDYTMQLITFYI